MCSLRKLFSCVKSISFDINGNASGTWITDSFSKIVSEIMNDRQKRKQKNENESGSGNAMDDVLRFMCFELWEKESMELCAVTFSYEIGSVLCDYTCLTMKKDQRSCGNILTKVIGDLLLKCNFDLWYWGFLLEYMKDEYCNSKYHGKEIPREEFFNVLKNSYKYYIHQIHPLKVVNGKNESVLDVIDFIKSGQALIQPLPNW